MRTVIGSAVLALAFAPALAQHPRIRKGKLPVGLVGNRLKPWTNASQQAMDQLKQWPYPLVAQFDFMEGALPFVKINAKMGETSDVRVVATAGGKHYQATKEIKVTIGGCGG